MSMKKLIVLFVSLLIVGAIPQSLLAQSKLYLNEFDLDQVTLLDGPFKHARDLNIEVLLEYDTDRMLAPYRKEAGLEPKSPSYDNWIGLDGHVGGHYLTAMAMNYAATGNEDCKRRMDYMVSELKAIQEANAKNHSDWGVGYVGGVPESEKIWTAVQRGDIGTYRSAWVPWYNVHKMYAGLRDAWLYGESQEAREIFLKLCDWGIEITSGLSEEQMERMLDVEHGGINESFADAYQMTGDEKYLEAAKRFSHKSLLNPLSEGIDNLDNKHANTQIPKFVGFERIAELDDAQKYQDASSNFWENVVSKRSLALGGNSRREHFPSVNASIDYINVVDGPETCNSYNMLKLTEDLFRVNPEAKYVDFYEKTLFNHILSSQHPEHGGYVYFTPARPRHYRVYSAPNQAMWCCVGSGMENHSKYSHFIYTHTDEALYLNLFVASELNWEEKGVKIKQETSFPYEENTKLIITEGKASFKLMVRYPGWVKDGALSIKVNGKKYSFDKSPSSYVAIDRKWKKGDEVVIAFPMTNSVEKMPNVPEYLAFMHGPILLGTKTGTENMRGLIAGDGRWDQFASGDQLPVDKAPILIEDDLENIADKLKPVEGEPLKFTLDVKQINPIDITLEPFSGIHDSRYMMYWLSLTNDDYRAYLDSLEEQEKIKIALDKRTIDLVTPGEQQPEADHRMKIDKSRTGNNQDQFYREASNGGYFSYEMSTGNLTDLSLMVRYWGAEWGTRKFDIFIDDQKLITEDNSGRWNQSLLKDVVYEIPNEMVEGKDFVTVKFQALAGTTAGAVYMVRLLKNEE